MYTFSFNDIKKDFVYCDDEKGKRYSTFAPITRRLYTVPGRPGALVRGKDTQVRIIQQPIFFKGTSKENLRKLEEEVSSWLVTDEPTKLVFDDELDRIYYAVVDSGFDIEEALNLSEGTISFICPDPYKYGTEDTFFVDTSPIMNEGSAETNAIITATFTSAASEYKITHSNGKFVRVIWNFVAGDKLVIDLNKRKVLINNNVNMTAYYWKNHPFMLLPGENTLSVTPAAVATTQITFRPRWL